MFANKRMVKPQIGMVCAGNIEMFAGLPPDFRPVPQTYPFVCWRSCTVASHLCAHGQNAVVQGANFMMFELLEVQGTFLV